MRIIYTHHARFRMAQKGITEGMIEEVLNKPDTDFPSQDKRIARKTLGNKTMDVVYLETKRGYLIITAYWLLED